MSRLSRDDRPTGARTTWPSALPPARDSGNLKGPARPFGLLRGDRWGRPFRGSRTPVVTVGQSVRRLIAVAAASFVLCALVYAVFDLTAAGQWLADAILYGRPTDARTGELVSETLATISVATLIGATIGLAVMAAVSGRLRLAVAVVVAIVGANLTTQVFKRVVLERPNLVGGDAFSYGNSFPSGHVTIAASLVLVALLVVPRALRAPAAILGAAYVAAVAMSTLAAGWHRIADAAGAVLIALGWTALVSAGLARWSFMPRRSWRLGSARRITVLLARGGALVLVIGGALLLIAWLDPQVATQSVDDQAFAPRAFLAAVALIAGAALTAAASLLWAMRGIDLDRP